MIRLALVLSLAPVSAGAFDLALPLDCAYGTTCFVQNYPDRDPGAGFRDFACGPLGYDGHDGTDFALPTLAAMQAGVAVRAAAAGVVTAVRDGMPDISSADPAAPALAGRDCGNGVVIDHGDGWETQYCHLRQGSIAVTPGDPVDPGTPLGQVGLSGQTEFPHLHLSVRHHGQPVDPFAPDAAAPCGEAGPDPLWSDPLPYLPGGILGAGLADAMPEFEAIQAGLATPATFARQAPAMVLWVHVFGGQAGDVVRFDLTGPGAALLAEEVTLDRTQARLFRAVGKRAGATGWPPGRYSGTVRLRRGGKTLGEQAVAVTVTP